MHNQIKILDSLKLILLSFMLFFGNIAFATTDYKEVTVNSIDQLEQAVGSVTVPTLITLTNGTYNSRDITLKGNSSEVIVKAQTRSKAIIQTTIYIYGSNITIQGVLFNGKAGSIESFGNNNRITRCTWDNSYKRRWIRGLGDGIKLEVDHCLFMNKPNGQVQPSAQILSANFSEKETTPREHYWHHNYFKDIPRGRDGNGYEAVQIYTVEQNPVTLGIDHNCRLEYNLFEHVDGEGELISNKANGSIIKGNTIINSKGGLVLRYGRNAEVSYNFIFGGGTPYSVGIRVSGDNHNIHHNYIENTVGEAFELYDASTNYAEVSNLKMHNNYIADGRYNLRLGRVMSNGNGAKPKGQIYNNTFVQNNADQILSWGVSSPDGITFTGNTYYGILGVSNLKGFEKTLSQVLKPSLSGVLTPNDVGPDALDTPDPKKLSAFTISPNGVLQ